MNGETPEIGINGMAHVILTVSQFDKARAFYSALLPQFGMACVSDGPDFCYHVGARTAIGVRRCDPEFEGGGFSNIALACIIFACAGGPLKTLIKRRSWRPNLGLQ